MPLSVGEEDYSPVLQGEVGNMNTEILREYRWRKGGASSALASFSFQHEPQNTRVYLPGSEKRWKKKAREAFDGIIEAHKTTAIRRSGRRLFHVGDCGSMYPSAISERAFEVKAIEVLRSVEIRER